MWQSMVISRRGVHYNPILPLSMVVFQKFGLWRAIKVDDFEIEGVKVKVALICIRTPLR